MGTTSIYKKSKKFYRSGDIDLINNRIVAAGIDLTQGYTVDLDNDDYLDDLPADSVITNAVLTGKTVDDTGAFQADDVIFPSVESGKVIGAVILFKDTGYDNSSNLLYYSDNAVGLPVIGDGDNVVIRWPDPILE